jgi:DNA-directed RNA polymerase subunit E"
MKQRACKMCKMIHEASKCPDCGSKEFIENFKGKIYVLNPEKSEIARKLKIEKKGNFAIKAR